MPMTVSVMGELKDSVRKTYILRRGAYTLPTEEVTPVALPAVMKFDERQNGLPIKTIRLPPEYLLINCGRKYSDEVSLKPPATSVCRGNFLHTLNYSIG